jgi:hypothetical protein
LENIGVTKGRVKQLEEKLAERSREIAELVSEVGRLTDLEQTRENELRQCNGVSDETLRSIGEHALPLSQRKILELIDESQPGTLPARQYEATAIPDIVLAAIFRSAKSEDMQVAVVSAPTDSRQDLLIQVQLQLDQSSRDIRMLFRRVGNWGRWNFNGDRGRLGSDFEEKARSILSAVSRSDWRHHANAHPPPNFPHRDPPGKGEERIGDERNGYSSSETTTTAESGIGERAVPGVFFGNQR